MTVARPAESVNAVIKAYDIRGVVGEQLDADFVRDTGSAFARLMRAEDAQRIVIGHDMRASSPELVSTAGFAAAGVWGGMRCVKHPLVASSAVPHAVSTTRLPVRLTSMFSLPLPPGAERATRGEGSRRFDV